MKESEKQQKRNKQVTEVKTFSVPSDLGETKEYIFMTTPSNSQPSIQQIVNKAFDFHSQGNINEATKYYKYFINQGFKDFRVFSNYGSILRDLGKLQEAEVFTRKATELSPDLAEGHFNLGNILMDLGDSQDAEKSYRKAIALIM